MLTLRSAMEVVEEEGFQELLDGVRGRIDEIESLHRTRELTVRSPCYLAPQCQAKLIRWLVQGPR